MARAAANLLTSTPRNTQYGRNIMMGGVDEGRMRRDMHARSYWQRMEEASLSGGDSDRTSGTAEKIAQLHRRQMTPKQRHKQTTRPADQKLAPSNGEIRLQRKNTLSAHDTTSTESFIMQEPANDAI